MLLEEIKGGNHDLDPVEEFMKPGDREDVSTCSSFTGSLLLVPNLLSEDLKNHEAEMWLSFLFLPIPITDCIIRGGRRTR